MTSFRSVLIVKQKAKLNQLLETHTHCWLITNQNNIDCN